LLQSHSGAVDLVDLSLIHLLPLECKQCALLVFQLALVLSIQQLRFDLLLQVRFSVEQRSKERS
jgi:hypothetical protein